MLDPRGSRVRGSMGQSQETRRSSFQLSATSPCGPGPLQWWWCTTVFNPPDYPERLGFDQGGNRDSEQSSRLPKVSELCELDPRKSDSKTWAESPGWSSRERQSHPCLSRSSPGGIPFLFTRSAFQASRPGTRGIFRSARRPCSPCFHTA